MVFDAGTTHTQVRGHVASFNAYQYKRRYRCGKRLRAVVVDSIVVIVVVLMVSTGWYVTETMYVHDVRQRRARVKVDAIVVMRSVGTGFARQTQTGVWKGIKSKFEHVEEIHLRYDAYVYIE